MFNWNIDTFTRYNKIEMEIYLHVYTNTCDKAKHDLG